MWPILPSLWFITFSVIHQLTSCSDSAHKMTHVHWTYLILYAGRTSISYKWVGSLDVWIANITDLAFQCSLKNLENVRRWDQAAQRWDVRQFMEAMCIDICWPLVVSLQVIHVCRVRSLVKKMILLQATACIFQHLYLSDSFGIVCFGASFWIYLLFVLIHPSRAFFSSYVHVLAFCLHTWKKDKQIFFCLSAWLHIFCILFLFVIFFVSSFWPPGWQPYLLRAKFSKESVSQVTMRLILHTKGEWAIVSLWFS